jgi:hypothetical protein
LGLDHLVWRLLLWNLLNWWLLIRGISLRNLLWILLCVILSSFGFVSLVVGARVRVIIILTVLLYNKVIMVLVHPLLLIIVPMELLNLMHSLS